MTDWRCGTCRWFKPPTSKDRSGSCIYEVPEIVVPAVAIVRISWKGAWPDGGTDCPTWEARGGILPTGEKS